MRRVLLKMFKSPCKDCASRCDNCSLSDSCTLKADLPNGCGRCHDYCDKFLTVRDAYNEDLKVIKASRLLEASLCNHRLSTNLKIAKKYGAYRK